MLYVNKIIKARRWGMILQQFQYESKARLRYVQRCRDMWSWAGSDQIARRITTTGKFVLSSPGGAARLFILHKHNNIVFQSALTLYYWTYDTKCTCWFVETRGSFCRRLISQLIPERRAGSLWYFFNIQVANLEFFSSLITSVYGSRLLFWLLISYGGEKS